MQDVRKYFTSNFQIQGYCVNLIVHDKKWGKNENDKYFFFILQETASLRAVVHFYRLVP